MVGEQRSQSVLLHHVCLLHYRLMLAATILIVVCHRDAWHASAASRIILAKPSKIAQKPSQTKFVSVNRHANTVRTGASEKKLRGGDPSQILFLMDISDGGRQQNILASGFINFFLDGSPVRKY